MRERKIKDCPHCGVQVTWLEVSTPFGFDPAVSVRCGACDELIYDRGAAETVAWMTSYGDRVKLAQDRAKHAGLTVAPYPQRGDGINRDEA